MIDAGLDVSRIRAITLDLDDTLWPIWPAIARAEDVLQELARRFNLSGLEEKASRTS